MTYLIFFVIGIIFATFLNPIIASISELFLSVIELIMTKMEVKKTHYAKEINDVNIEIQLAGEKILNETAGAQPQIGFIIPDEDCMEEEFEE